MQNMIPSSIKSNLGTATFVQLVNAVIPLFVIPHLSRALGASEYGLLVWIQSIMSFGTIWVEFGCGWSSVQKLSENRANPSSIGHIFINTWILQWILFSVFSIATILLAYFFDKGRLEAYIVGLGIVAGYLLSPFWLFQGLEKWKLFAFSQCIGKLALLPLVLLIVKNREDVLAAISCFSLSSLLMGMFSLVLALRLVSGNFNKPSYYAVKAVFLESAALFASRAAITTYTTLVPLAVGSIAGLEQLAYFNIAEKLKSSLQSIVAPIQQVVFPRISWLITNNPAAVRILLKKSIVLVFLVTATLGSLFLLVPSVFVTFLGGKDFGPAQAALRWLAFVPLLTSVSNILGMQIMIPFLMHKHFSASILVGAVFCALIIYPCVKLNGSVGAAQVVLATELLIVIVMLVILRCESVAKDRGMLRSLFL